MAEGKLSFAKLLKIVKRVWELSEEKDADTRPVLIAAPPVEVTPGYVSLPWVCREDVFQKVFVKEMGYQEFANVQRTVDQRNQGAPRPTAQD